MTRTPLPRVSGRPLRRGPARSDAGRGPHLGERPGSWRDRCPDGSTRGGPSAASARGCLTARCPPCREPSTGPTWSVGTCVGPLDRSVRSGSRPVSCRCVMAPPAGAGGTDVPQERREPASHTRETGSDLRNVVGDTGFEPVTSSVSRKRATAAPIARVLICRERWVRDLNPCTRICSPLPRLSANPPRRPNQGETSPSGRRGSNSRPQPWQGCALPTELRPLAPLPVSRSACVRTVADAPDHAKSAPFGAFRPPEGVRALPRVSACACG
jgi:hypothetical protein